MRQAVQPAECAQRSSLQFTYGSGFPNAASQQNQAARNELQELQRKKAALSLELISLEDASRNRKQGTRGPGAIPANTEASCSVV